MLCVCEKGTVVAFFFFTFAKGFPPHVTEVPFAEGNGYVL